MQTLTPPYSQPLDLGGAPLPHSARLYRTQSAALAASMSQVRKSPPLSWNTERWIARRGLV